MTGEQGLYFTLPIELVEALSRLNLAGMPPTGLLFLGRS